MSAMEMASASVDEPAAASTPSMLSRAVDRLLGLVLCAVVLLNFVSAAARYVGGRAIVGADEVQVYLVVWLVFVGGAIVMWRRAHLRMDVLTAGLQGRAAKARNVLEGLIGTAACGTMSVVSLRFVLQIHEMGQLSDGAGIPMWIPHAAVLVGFVLMSAAAVFDLVRGVRALFR
jgi:TRAP-type transport system small permease protein